MIKNSLVPEDEYDPSFYDPPGIMHQILQAATDLPPLSIVAFHGSSGGGKSCSARWLGQKLGCEPIHLDNFQKFQPDGSPQGFDEDAMRQAIENARYARLRIVEGVCACRVCKPALLVTFGRWSTYNLNRLRLNLKIFIGDYDPTSYEGSISTFEAQYRGT